MTLGVVTLPRISRARHTRGRRDDVDVDSAADAHHAHFSVFQQRDDQSGDRLLHNPLFPTSWSISRRLREIEGDALRYFFRAARAAISRWRKDQSTRLDRGEKDPSSIPTVGKS